MTTSLLSQSYFLSLHHLASAHVPITHAWLKTALASSVVEKCFSSGTCHIKDRL